MSNRLYIVFFIFLVCCTAKLKKSYEKNTPYRIFTLLLQEI
nr:MAG TPA: hypothetical protein [Microviridae sp.]